MHYHRAVRLPCWIEENSELTCLSGIYVPNDERWPEHFRGIGIRIEDSVCVGEEHPIVLTMEAVKEVFHFSPEFLQTRLTTSRSTILRLSAHRPYPAKRRVNDTHLP
jgi:Xaa-Pro aminopeptidase